MNIGRILGWACFGIAFSCAVFLWGHNVGRIEEGVRVMELQEPSAQALADNIVIIQECRMEVVEVREGINDFTFGVCKQLGLIKGGS